MRYSEARSVRTRPVVKGPGLVWQVSWGMLSCGRALCAGLGFVMAWQVWRVSFRCCGVGSGSDRQGRYGRARSGKICFGKACFRSVRKGMLCFVMFWQVWWAVLGHFMVRRAGMWQGRFDPVRVARIGVAGRIGQGKARCVAFCWEWAR